MPVARLTTIGADAQLVQMCLRGEGPAWEELVKRHTRRVYKPLLPVTGVPSEAEDLTPGGFLRSIGTLASTKRYEVSPTWLPRGTRNLLVATTGARGETD